MSRLSKPFLFGTISTFVGKKADEQKYNWTVYIRGMDREDLSYFIRKVTFLLHDSFEPPLRGRNIENRYNYIGVNMVNERKNAVCEMAPFEVHESGWGEFSIGITVYFHDITIKPVEFFHHLKLFSDPSIVSGGGIRRPVVAENYDEFVFFDVNEEFKKILNAGPLRFLPQTRLDDHYNPKEKWNRDENAQYSQLAIAHDAVLKQIIRLKNEILEAEAENATFREHLALMARNSNPNLSNSMNLAMRNTGHYTNVVGVDPASSTPQLSQNAPMHQQVAVGQQSQIQGGPTPPVIIL